MINCVFITLHLKAISTSKQIVRSLELTDEIADSWMVQVSESLNNAVKQAIYS